MRYKHMYIQVVPKIFIFGRLKTLVLIDTMRERERAAGVQEMPLIIY